MCFSPQADLIGGAVICGIGVDALRHVDRRPSHIALATLPVVFGAHQIVEAFVWFSLQGHFPAGLGRTALWIYLIVAFVFLPIFVPIAVAAIEPSRGEDASRPRWPSSAPSLGACCWRRWCAGR